MLYNVRPNNEHDGETLTGTGFFDSTAYGASSLEREIHREVQKAIRDDFSNHCAQSGVSPQDWVVGNIEYHITTHAIHKGTYSREHGVSFSYSFYAGTYKPGIKVYNIDGYTMKRVYNYKEKNQNNSDDSLMINIRP